MVVVKNSIEKNAAFNLISKAYVDVVYIWTNFCNVSFKVAPIFKLSRK